MQHKTYPLDTEQLAKIFERCVTLYAETTGCTRERAEQVFGLQASCLKKKELIVIDVEQRSFLR